MTVVLCGSQVVRYSESPVLGLIILFVVVPMT